MLEFLVYCTQCADDFFYLQRHDDLPKLIGKRVVFNASYGLTETPYVVFCGLIEDLTCCHVVFSGVIYTFSAPHEAIDCCFKIFFSLRVDYPWTCQHIWSFFQLYVYKIEKAKKTVAVRIISELSIELDK